MDGWTLLDVSSYRSSVSPFGLQCPSVLCASLLLCILQRATWVPSHNKENCMQTNDFRVTSCGLSMNFCIRTFVLTLDCFWTSVSSSVWKEVWLSRPWELTTLDFSELGLLRELASEHPAGGTVAEPKGSSWQLHKTVGPMWGCRWIVRMLWRLRAKWTEAVWNLQAYLLFRDHCVHFR